MFAIIIKYNFLTFLINFEKVEAVIELPLVKSFIDTPYLFGETAGICTVLFN